VTSELSTELPCLIREYQDSDRAAALSLVNRVFAAAFDHYEPKSPEWWAWKFEAGPSGHKSLVVEDPEGAIIGFYAGLLLEVRAAGSPFRFAQSVDTVVDPAFRRGLKNPGLFVRLAQAYESSFAGPDRAAVMYGLPIPNAYRIGARFMDYWMLRAQSALVLRNDRKLPPIDPALDVIEVSNFNEELDALARTAFRREVCVGRRDAAWMNWRFPPTAGDPYRRLQVRHRPSGRLLLNLVWREAHFLGRDVIAVVDAVLAPEASLAHAAAMRVLLSLAGERGRDLVTLAAPTSDWAGELFHFGFRTEPTLYVMVGRPFHPDLDSRYLRESWHYTLADLDVI
jgi:hypothetical protein